MSKSSTQKANGRPLKTISIGALSRLVRRYMVRSTMRDAGWRAVAKAVVAAGLALTELAARRWLANWLVEQEWGYRQGLPAQIEAAGRLRSQVAGNLPAQLLPRAKAMAALKCGYIDHVDTIADKPMKPHAVTEDDILGHTAWARRQLGPKASPKDVRARAYDKASEQIQANFDAAMGKWQARRKKRQISLVLPNLKEYRGQLPQAVVRALNAQVIATMDLVYRERDQRAERFGKDRRAELDRDWRFAGWKWDKVRTNPPQKGQPDTPKPEYKKVLVQLFVEREYLPPNADGKDARLVKGQDGHYRSTAMILDALWLHPHQWLGDPPSDDVIAATDPGVWAAYNDHAKRQGEWRRKAAMMLVGIYLDAFPPNRMTAKFEQHATLRAWSEEGEQIREMDQAEQLKRYRAALEVMGSDAALVKSVLLRNSIGPLGPELMQLLGGEIDQPSAALASGLTSLRRGLDTLAHHFCIMPHGERVKREHERERLDQPPLVLWEPYGADARFIGPRMETPSQQRKREGSAALDLNAAAFDALRDPAITEYIIEIKDSAQSAEPNEPA